MLDIFSGLNDDQIAAVTATEGYVRVVAGAGSGKTRTLTHRYAYLVKAAGIHPSNVLCVTFTSKAAGEMKRRVRQLIGDGYDNSLITTYHGFCVRVLREDIHRLMYPQRFTIIDEGDQRRILSDIYAELELKLDHASFEKLRDGIHRMKSDESYAAAALSGELSGLRIPPLPGTPSDPLDDRIARMYVERQRRIFGLDFDDLIAYVFEIFKTFPEVREKWSDRLYYIQVDEFQDSSRRELRLIKQLCATHGNLFVVGDPDQNIYEWRGADVSIIVDFDKIFPGTQTIRLDRNYRSSGHILSAANSLIANNRNRIPKDLYTEDPDGEPLTWYHGKNEKDEGKLVTDEILRLVRDEKYEYRGIAVLYRAGFVSRFIEQALGEARIPYEIYGSVRFYDRMEIKDAVSYMKLIAGDDDEALVRIINVPRRSFGKTRLAALTALAEDERIPMYQALKRHIGDPVFAGSGAPELVKIIDALREKKDSVSASALMQETLSLTGYESYIRAGGSMERLDNLAELKRSVWDREQSWGETYTIGTWLGQIAVEADEYQPEETDKVKLMTVHSAKGLEFPAVFTVGMSDGVFPSSRTLEERKDAGLEEERRLCFVAMTRAMKRLYLSESEGGSEDDGKNRSRRPSRFLAEIGEKDMIRVGELPKELLPDASAADTVPAGNAGLAVGSEVDHPIFGRGVIEKTDAGKGVFYIRFEKSGQLRPVSADYDFSAATAARIPKPAAREDTAEAPAKAPEPAAVPEPAAAEIPDPVKEEPPIPPQAAAEEPPALAAETHPGPEPLEQPAKPDQPEPPGRSGPEQMSLDIPEPQPRPEMPKRWKNAEWAKELTFDDGETNLWKRADVPHSGWFCTGVVDLGEPVGICRMCGYQIIRYVHIMRHPGYPRTIGAGCECAGKMEGDVQRARKRETAYKNRLSRRETFLNSRTKRSRAGNEYFKYKGEIVTVMPDKFKPDHWKTAYKGAFSLPFVTKRAALEALFDIIDPWEYEERN